MASSQPLSNGKDTFTTSVDSSHQFFEQQRQMMLREIGTSLESVLQNVNKLNRSLEGITSVGSELSAVEALWSHFETVMDGGHGRAENAEGMDRNDK